MTIGGDSSIAVEMTSITAGPLRGDRKALENLGGELRRLIGTEPDLAAKVSGHVLLLEDAAEGAIPRGKTATSTVQQLASIIMSADLNSWSDIRNFDICLDSVDGIRIRVVKGQRNSPGEVQVKTSTTHVTLSQARRLLADVLIKKNYRSREYVVICAGDPDKDGLVVPLDIVVFELLQGLGAGDLPSTPNIRTAWLHLPGTTELVRCI